LDERKWITVLITAALLSGFFFLLFHIISLTIEKEEKPVISGLSSGLT